MRRLRELMHHVADDGAFIGRPRVYIGGRGVGKTSLLRYAHRVAVEQGLGTVWVTAGDAGVLAVLSAELEKLTARWQNDLREDIKALVRHLELSISVPGVSVKTRTRPIPGAGDSPGQVLEELIGKTAYLLRSSGSRGLAIFVDELQSADEIALRSLAYAWQNLRSWNGPEAPAVLVAAGLGHTSDVVTDAATFGERFEFLRLKDLGRESAYAAIREPAEDRGVTWDYDALNAVLEKANGYPYFVQLYGDAAWQAAGNPDPGGRITLGTVTAAEDEVAEQLEVFYRTRWGKATATERELLRAIAQQATPTPRRRDVAAALGKRTTAISMARRSLMDKGILDSPERGLLAFTAPGFSDYILEYEGTED